LWPLAETAASNRGGQSGRPERAVFDKMEQVGLITMKMHRRLMSGRHV
jgi:hypothetical protein